MAKKLMYNTQRLEQWKIETEELLQKIVDERRPLLQEIVNQEVPSKFKIMEGNGTVFLLDKKGDAIYPEESETFINELSNMQYDYLDLCITPTIPEKRSLK